MKKKKKKGEAPRPQNQVGERKLRSSRGEGRNPTKAGAERERARG